MVTRILDLVLSSGSNNLIIPQAHQKGNIALFVKFNLTIPSSAGRNPRWLKDNPQSVLPAGFQGIFQSTPILLRNRFDPLSPKENLASIQIDSEEEEEFTQISTEHRHSLSQSPEYLSNQKRAREVS